MKKYLFVLFLILGLFVSSLVLADLINPDYLIKHCPPSKIQRECFYSTDLPFGPTTKSNCGLYKNNSLCKLLVSTGSSFGGQERYCCEPGFENPSFLFMSQIKRFGLTLLLTLLLEIPVFWLFGFRKKRELLIIILANVISVSTFYIASFWFSGFLFVLISELIIIIFEIIFLVKILKGVNIKKIILATLVANLISAIIGVVLIHLIDFLTTFGIIR